MHEWTDDLMEVVTDWLRVHDIEVKEDALEELADDMSDALNWRTMMKMSAMMGGRI